MIWRYFEFQTNKLNIYRENWFSLYTYIFIHIWNQWAQDDWQVKTYQKSTSWQLMQFRKEIFLTKGGIVDSLTCQSRNHYNFDRSALVNSYLNTEPSWTLLYTCTVKTCFLWTFLSLLVWQYKVNVLLSKPKPK